MWQPFKRSPQHLLGLRSQTRPCRPVNQFSINTWSEIARGKSAQNMIALERYADQALDSGLRDCLHDSASIDF